MADPTSAPAGIASTKFVVIVSQTATKIPAQTVPTNK